MKKPVLAHLPPTVLATFATAIAISLSGFLLAGAGGQAEPAPLLPAIGSAAGHVIAELPATPHAHARKPARRASVGGTASLARLATTSTRGPASPRRAGVSKARRVHRPDRAVRRPAPAPTQPAARPAPAAPVITREFTSAHKARGKALGHSHSHARSVRAPATSSAHGRGHVKAHGRHGGLPPGHAKKAPAAPAPAPAAPAKSKGGGPPPDHGGGNGHKEDKK